MIKARIAVVLLVGIMLVSGLACGCGNGGGEPTPTPTPTPRSCDCTGTINVTVNYDQECSTICASELDLSSVCCVDSQGGSSDPCTWQQTSRVINDADKNNANKITYSFTCNGTAWDVMYDPDRPVNAGESMTITVTRP